MRSGRLRVLVPVVALVLVACGNDADDDEVEELPPPDETPAEPEPEPEPEPTPTPTPEPTPETELYEVQSGDTLSEIAAEFGTTVDAIVEANDLEDPDEIHIGDELVIPLDG